MLLNISQQIQQCNNKIKHIQTDLEKYNEDKRIAAREGDLRENDAYQVAINAIEQCNGELYRIQSRLNALRELQDLDYINTGYASLGSTVTIFREDTLEMFTFLLVPDALGDAESNCIAITSLLGRNVIGTQVNDSILINTGLRTYKARIVAIE